MDRSEIYILEVELIGHDYELKWEVRESIKFYAWLYNTRNTVDRNAIYRDGEYWRSNNKREIKGYEMSFRPLNGNVKNTV